MTEEDDDICSICPTRALMQGHLVSTSDITYAVKRHFFKMAG